MKTHSSKIENSSLVLLILPYLVHLTIYNKVMLEMAMKLHFIENKLVKEYFMRNSFLKLHHIKYDKHLLLEIQSTVKS